MLTATHTANFILASARDNGLLSPLFKAHWTSIASSSATFPSSLDELEAMDRENLLRSMKNFNVGVLSSDPLLAREGGVAESCAPPVPQTIRASESDINSAVSYVNRHAREHGLPALASYEIEFGEHIVDATLDILNSRNFIPYLPALPDGSILISGEEGIMLFSEDSIPNQITFSHKVLCTVEQTVLVKRKVWVDVPATLDMQRGSAARTVLHTLIEESASDLAQGNIQYEDFIENALSTILENTLSNTGRETLLGVSDRAVGSYGDYLDYTHFAESDNNISISSAYFEGIPYDAELKQVEFPFYYSDININNTPSIEYLISGYLDGRTTYRELYESRVQPNNGEATGDLQ